MFDGGQGFGDDTQGGGFMASDATASPAQDKKKRAQNLVPVCIRQVLEAPENGILLEEMEVHMVDVVALVTSIEHHTTKVTYTLDDTTGSIAAVHWISDTKEEFTQVMENTYCRVVGQLRSTRGVKSLMVLQLSPIKSLNELTTHLLEVMLTPLKLKQINTQQNTMTGTKSGGMPMKDMNGSFNQGQFDMGGMGGLLDGLTQTQKAVYQCIAAVMDERGIHKNQIVSNLKGKFSNRDISDAWEFLSCEGHIYTTVDDDYFKVTDG